MSEDAQPVTIVVVTKATKNTTGKFLDSIMLYLLLKTYYLK